MTSPHPSIFDPDSRALLGFKQMVPRAVPTTFVLDRTGKVAALSIGPLTARDFLPVIQGIASEKPGPARISRSGRRGSYSFRFLILVGGPMTDPTGTAAPRFARQYLKIAVGADRRGGAEHRHRLLDGLTGRVLEVGAGQGRNFRNYPDTVDEVVALEHDDTLRTARTAIRK